MKKIINLIVIILLFGSCTAPKIIFDGKKYVTEKRYFKDNLKMVKKSLKKMSKEDQKIILGSDIEFKYKEK
jgi:hypothetical protein